MTRLDVDLASMSAADAADPLFVHGARVAIAFVGFARFVRQLVDRYELEALFAVSREGPFLARVLAAADPRADVHVLDVSRRSLLLPSIDTFDTSNLMRLWERYPRQTPRAFLGSLGLDGEAFETAVLRHGLALDVSVHQPWSDPRFVRLLGDAQFIGLATAARDRARTLATRYLDDAGYGGARVGVVDVGWRGTIQDSLALLVPSTMTIGCLLAYRPADLASAGPQKCGFVAGAADDGLFGQEIRMCADPLEMLCLSPGGSVAAFHEVGDRVTPLRRPSENEERVLQDDVARFQAGIIDAIPVIVSRLDRLGVGREELRHLAMNALKDLLFSPSAELLGAYRRYRQGGHPEEALRVRDALLAPFSRRHWLSLRAAVQEHGWPHALLQDVIGKTGFTILRRLARKSTSLGRWFA